MSVHACFIRYLRINCADLEQFRYKAEMVLATITKYLSLDLLFENIKGRALNQLWKRTEATLGSAARSNSFEHKTCYLTLE